MKHLFLAVLAALLLINAATAQTVSVQDVLQSQRELLEKSSRKTIAPAIDAIASSGLPQMQSVLEAWQSKNMWQRKADGLFFLATKNDDGTYALQDFQDGAPRGNAIKKDLKQLKPNSGIRAMIATALVQFQLSDPDAAKRRAALDSIARDPEAAALAPLRASIEGEVDADILARKTRLNQLMTMSFDTDTTARVEAINAMAGDLSVDFRGTLNPLLATKMVITDADTTPEGNIASKLRPGTEALAPLAAYEALVANGLAPALTTNDARDALLEANISNARIAGVPVAQLATEAKRNEVYDLLVDNGVAPARVTASSIEATLDKHSFYDLYLEPSPQVTTAAKAALAKSQTRVSVSQAADLGLDALSLASIYFLAAIGLAITFGVMGVINMAHGEFIMMGAYTGYVVQQFVPNHTLSIILAVPLAFAVTFAAGVALERLVIRWLYHRPLETLLATFGVSIALQQLAKNIFGTQARPLTSPAWLDGAWVINDVLAISYIRIAIFILALLFLGLFLFIMKRTRLGLETRATTQNQRMASSMGINTDRVNMLTFGLGSGIAGIAGVAIGLFAKVTSEMGDDYIVQSFMTVVVGGVGNIWGTLAGAMMIGGFQKGVEWLNPSNTLAAQTYMIIFIIIFIQFRPRGIIALKGRAAGD
ncbi:urea ABC transporter permease subunit UrtB [uncultured Litoreibacter sp.]|uniref:urea ABC transporter permease subunit UrtB n=1 Tax=uncultured Litoreibacter sp. TaxID=1392394 RepID=UPI00262477A3|nr:urea ABC transporter permease subunit UrtB [uncultured Litoreibacter sp.]